MAFVNELCLLGCSSLLLPLFIMASPCSTSIPILAKPCQCQSQLVSRNKLSRSPTRTGYGALKHLPSSKVALVCAVQQQWSSETKTKSQPAEPTPQQSEASRSRPAASSDLLQVLATAVITQGFKQLQDTVAQLQPAGNKLLKGFLPRPPGYPPGAARLAEPRYAAIPC